MRSAQSETIRDRLFDTDEAPADELLRRYGAAFEDLSLLLVDSQRLSQSRVSAETLDNYLARLSQLPPLDLDLQDALARRYAETGSEDVGRLLVLSSLRLVVSVAKEYRRRGVEMMELVQEGNVGLAQALDRFDPTRDVRFSSYARYWIKARILGYLLNNSTIVRLGTTRSGRKLFYQLGRARRALRKDGHEPTTAEIAAFLDLDERDVVAFTRQVDQRPVSTEERVAGTEIRVGERLIGAGPTPEDALARRDAVIKVERLIFEFGETLERERDRAIWNERMLAEERKTLRELSEAFDVSKERIRQVENQIRRRFSSYLRREVDGAEELAAAYLVSA